MRRLSLAGLLLVLAMVASSAGTSAGADAAAPGRGGADASLILDRNSYFRVHTQFGLMRLSGRPLREEGRKILGNGLTRVERYVKRLLKGRNYDWSETDWRDVAVYHLFTGQCGDDSDAMATIASIVPPATWADPDFDDSSFDRVRPGNLCLHIDEWGDGGFREASFLLRRALYYRTYFEVPDPSAAGGMTVRVTYRGGARVFVNGRELGRANLPAGPIAAETLADEYPLEAYTATRDELPARPGWWDEVGDLRSTFEQAPPAEGSRGEFRVGFGNTPINKAGWERITKARDRVLGPLTIPPRLLRKGANVLAIELRTAPYHPLIIPGARGQQRSWGGGMSGNPRWDHVRLVNVELRGNRGAEASALQRPAGMQVWVEDMHTRLFDRDYNPPGWPAGTVRLVAARHGTFAAQLAVGTDAELTGLEAVSSDLTGEGGARIPAGAVKVQYMVPHGLNEMGMLGTGRSEPAGLGYLAPMARVALARYAADIGNPFGPLPRDGEAARKARERFIRDFKFFDHISPHPPARVPADSCQPIWLSLTVPESAPAGRYTGRVTVRADGRGAVAVPVEAEVIGWRVPGPREFQTYVQSEQSPYGVAKAYKVQLWSPRHFELMESSFRQLARLGNDWVYVPVLMNSELGNFEDTMVRCIRKADGSFRFDFGLADRYLALAERVQGRPKMVCFLVMHGAKALTNAVKVTDEATGRTEAMEVGPAQDATRRPFWRAFGAAAYEHMAALGLQEAMYWGQAFDDVPDKSLIGILAEVAPGVGWTCAGHGRAPDATFRVASRAYGVDLLPRSAQGWKNPFIHLLMARTGGSVICVEGISTPFSYRVMCDRMIHCGFNGLGRLGADYFNGTWLSGFKGGYWCMVGRAAVQTLWPGPDGIESSARHEATLEGIQEAEARIFLEQALDRGVLPEELAAEAQAVLDDHFRATLHIPTGCVDHQTMDITNGWQGRSRRLYRMAARVAEAIGLDVDRTSFGADSLTFSVQGQRTTFSGKRVSVPALGKTRLAVRLRNWSDRPRRWKASGSEAWIVPAKAAGSVIGQQELTVVLDGRTLREGQDVSGTLNVTDTAAGTTYPIRIAAHVGKAVELKLRQDITFVSGGGAGAESPKTIRLVSEPVFNVAAGGSDAKEYLLVSHASQEQPWSIDCGADWLRAEPAAGRIAPGSSARVRLIARPRDDVPGQREATLTFSAANGAVREECRVRAYVIPPYRRPTVPPGPAVYLNELDRKCMVRHVDAGFSKETRDPRPWIFAEVPKPYYTPFNRAEHRPEGFTGDPETFPYKMGGKESKHGLWVSPYHETVYHIEGMGLAAFAAEVGSYDKRAAGGGNTGSVVCFEVYVDGKLRAQSGLMKVSDAPRLLVVDGLGSAKRVTLVTRRDDLVNDWYTVVTWGDPRFIKAR